MFVKSYSNEEFVIDSNIDPKEIEAEPERE